VYDPDVHLSRLLGANRRFIEQHVPHIGSLMRSDIEAVVAECDLIIVGLNDRHIFEKLEQHTRREQTILDLVHIPSGYRLRGEVVGLSW
jgi:GDP-mannose 6-dehydrogenase